MKAFKKFYEIAHSGTSHGFQGHLLIFPHEEFENSFTGTKFLFFLIEGCYIPFEIVEKNRQAGGYSILLDGIDAAEENLSMRGQGVYLPEKDIMKEDLEVLSSPSALEGYVLTDQRGNELIIRHIEELSGQVMIMTTEDKMIPFVEEWIQNIDHEEQKIRIELPEGLMDLS